jgi:hypothetical protein
MEILIPNSLEMECLGALWRAQTRDQQALRPSDIRKAVNRRRTRVGKKPLAVSTISTVLRTATEKGLLREVRIGAIGRVRASESGSGKPKLISRSPNTAYQALCTPSQVFRATVRPLLAACPRASRPKLILDLAKLMRLPAMPCAQVVAALKAMSNAK